MAPCGLPFLLFYIRFVTNNAGVPRAAAFDVIFPLLDFVNLAAENPAWYLTTTPGTLCCPGFHFFSALFEILFASFHLLQPLFHTD
jgi:hypothetical protein